MKTVGFLSMRFEENENEGHRAKHRLLSIQSNNKWQRNLRGKI